MVERMKTRENNKCTMGHAPVGQPKRKDQTTQNFKQKQHNNDKIRLAKLQYNQLKKRKRVSYTST